MSILITWPADDPSTVRQETHDPQQIATAMKAIGCRFERRPVRDLALDATPDEVLETYKDVVDELVATEKFVKVDVATIHPSDAPDWNSTAWNVRSKFFDEHTHGDDDEVRFMVRGAGVFFLHIGDDVHAIYSVAGDLLGVPQGTTHWFDTGPTPDFTAIRFFHDPQGWVAVSTGSPIARRFPDFDAIRTRARVVGGA